MPVNINLDVNKLIEDSLSPVAEPAMNTLSAIWGLTFGRIDNYYEIKKLTDAKNLEDFKNKLEKEVSEIPEDNLKEPTLCIAGPALEASKFFFNEEELRNMFSKLIASSMDSSKVNHTYPSFAEIIKQMSKLDAQNLKIISSASSLSRAVCQIKINNSDGSFNIIYSNVYIANTDTTNYEDLSASLINLERLGLIDINYTQYLADESLYAKFENTDQFRDASMITSTRNVEHDPKVDKSSQDSNGPTDLNGVTKYDTPEIVKGIITVTSFGHKFIYTCL